MLSSISIRGVMLQSSASLEAILMMTMLGLSWREATARGDAGNE